MSGSGSLAGRSVLVTGASGFVGGSVLRALVAAGADAAGTARRPASGACFLASPELGPEADWRPLLASRSAVVHAAARVHRMKEGADSPLDEFRRENVEGTLALARQAAEAGVKRFLFVSSVKVHGEASLPGSAFTETDLPAPTDPYGISKLEAEQGLQALGTASGMEVTIVRPALVYGPGVGANFATMMRWLARGMPLPLGAVTGNRRTLVSLDNLVDLILTCLHHPAAANQVFLAGDAEDLSTAALLRRLAAAMGVPARLVPVPVPVLEAMAAVLGRRAMIRRLCGDLRVDVSKAARILGWAPPVGVDEGLRRAVQGTAARG